MAMTNMSLDEICWGGAQASADHPFLTANRIRVHGAVTTADGQLVMPMTDPSGYIHGAQLISAQGECSFHPASNLQGNFFRIGNYGDRIIVTTDFVIGARLYESTGQGVAVAFTEANLEAVVRSLRAYYPAIDIEIETRQGLEMIPPAASQPKTVNLRTLGKRRVTIVRARSQ